MTGCNYKPTTKEDLDKLVEALKPTYTVVTNSERVYKELLEMPFMSEENVKLSTFVNGTFVIDMQKLNDIMRGAEYDQEEKAEDLLQK